jgi:hypothetical protein
MWVTIPLFFEAMHNRMDVPPPLVHLKNRETRERGSLP